LKAWVVGEIQAVDLSQETKKILTRTEMSSRTVLHMHVVRETLCLLCSMEMSAVLPLMQRILIRNMEDPLTVKMAEVDHGQIMSTE